MPFGQDSLGVIQTIHAKSIVIANSLPPGGGLSSQSAASGFFGDVSPFQIGLALVTLGNAAWTSYFSFWQGPKVTLHVAGEIGIVVAPHESPNGVHVRCSVVNAGVKLGTLQHLELITTAPDGHKTTFRWNLFFRYTDGGGELVKETDVHPLAISGRDSVARFIEFKSSDHPRWAAGGYEVEILGWVNKRARRESANVRTVFHVDLPEAQVRRINQPEGFSVYAEPVPVREWARRPQPTAAMASSLKAD
jgi:hypothetical protein